MKLLCNLIAVTVVAFLSMGGCESTGGTAGGIGGTGIHGGVDVGTTINTADPTAAPTVTVGGHINFLKRPLNSAEMLQIHDIAYRAGVDFIKSGADATAEPKAKANLVRRLSYKFRVPASKLRYSTEAAFEEGAAAAGEGSPQRNAIKRL